MTSVLRRILNLSKDDLYRSSVILFIGSVAGGVASYLFQIIMGRMLSVATFGELNTLLALTTIIGIPFASITNYLAREVAGLQARDQAESANTFVLSNYRWILSIGLLPCFLLGASSGYLSGYLKMEQPVALVLLAVMIYVTLATSINRGVLQGVQNFWMLSFIPAGIGFSKLLFCVALVYLGYALAGVMTGIVVGSLLVFIVSFIPINRAFRQGFSPYTAETNPGARFLPILMANLAFAVLSQSDIILVKRLFTAYDAGIFSSAAIIAKIVLYLPTSLSLALFPMVAFDSHRGDRTLHYLSRSLLLTIAIALASVFVLYLFPQQLIALLFGDKFKVAAELLGPFALAVAPMTLVHLIMTYDIARGQVAAACVMLVAAVVQVVAIYLLHDSLEQVLDVILIVNSICAGLLLAMTLITVDRQSPDKETNP